MVGTNTTIDVVEKMMRQSSSSILSSQDWTSGRITATASTRALPIKRIVQIFEFLMLSAIVSSKFLLNNERLSGTIAGV